MLTPRALAALYALVAVLFVAGALTPHTWLIAASAALVASTVALQHGGTER